jgi:hypothetical protein
MLVTDSIECSTLPWSSQCPNMTQGNSIVLPGHGDPDRQDVLHHIVRVLKQLSSSSTFVPEHSEIRFDQLVGGQICAAL